MSKSLCENTRSTANSLESTNFVVRQDFGLDFLAMANTLKAKAARPQSQSQG